MDFPVIAGHSLRVSVFFDKIPTLCQIYRMQSTSEQYAEIRSICRKVFSDKLKDYGTSWRVLRPESLTDQIFIKANRIRTLQESSVQKVDEGIFPEFIGIVNYCIISLIQLACKDREGYEMENEEALELYDKLFSETYDLMLAKNHDYGEAWRDMRVGSFVDIILMRVMRIRQIEDQKGQTLVSEGVESNYMDMVNYAAFGLIKLRESGASDS